jgi:hypothetical protein
VVTHVGAHGGRSGIREGDGRAPGLRHHLADHGPPKLRRRRHANMHYAPFTTTNRVLECPRPTEASPVSGSANAIGGRHPTHPGEGWRGGPWGRLRFGAGRLRATKAAERCRTAYHTSQSQPFHALGARLLRSLRGVRGVAPRLLSSTPFRGGLASVRQGAQHPSSRPTLRPRRKVPRSARRGPRPRGGDDATRSTTSG